MDALAIHLPAMAPSIDGKVGDQQTEISELSKASDACQRHMQRGRPPLSGHAAGGRRDPPEARQQAGKGLEHGPLQARAVLQLQVRQLGGRPQHLRTRCISAGTQACPQPSSTAPSLDWQCQHIASVQVRPRGA